MEPSQLPPSQSKLQELHFSNHMLLPSGKHMQFLFNPVNEKYTCATFDENMNPLGMFSYNICSRDRSVLLSNIKPLGFALLSAKITLLAALAAREYQDDTLILNCIREMNQNESSANYLSCSPGSFYQTNFFYDKANDVVIVKTLAGHKNELAELQFTSSCIPGHEAKKEIIRRYSVQEIKQNP